MDDLNVILFYCDKNMNKQQQQLTLALEILAQRILDTNQTDHLILAKALLVNLDPSFQQLTHYCSSFPSLKQAIGSHYQQHRHEDIQWSELLDLDLGFILIGWFILDLALTSNTTIYIETILSLEEELQITLKVFVEQVTQRDKFILPRSSLPEEGGTSREHLVELVEQNQKLKLENDHWIRKYQDMCQNYNYLKTTHEKVAEEFNYLKQERYALISQLGGSQCGSVDQTVQRVRRELENYEKTVEKHQKDIEDKKTALLGKNQELQKLEESIKSQKNQERMAELEQAQRKIVALEREVTMAKASEDELNSSIHSLKEHLSSKEEEQLSLKQQLSVLEGYEAKYLSIRKIHNQFKSKIVKNTKQFKE